MCGVRRALEANASIVLLQDAFGHPKTDSRAALALRGEEWLENMWSDRGGNSRPVVGDEHTYAEPVRFPVARVFDANLHHTASRHGVYGIHDEI